MDSIQVNWETLDALIIEFAVSENLIEDPSSSSSSPSSSYSSSSYQSRLFIRRIRKFLEIGDIDAAVDLLRLHAPFVLHDHRLLFRLHKQKFIELLRKGTVEDRDCAIKCLRTVLAPCALDAYPEAYEEFKHVLLAFIYDKDDQTSPVADEWSEKRRFDIAGLLSSVLRAHLHAYDPVFSMALRYLISIHKGFCFRQGVSSPISDLTERLLLEERDPSAKPEESLYEVPPFDEVDIQALAHAVELTRQGAVDSLRFAKGDLLKAFQNELCRMKLNVSILDDLVREYCIYRGIVDSGSHIIAGAVKIEPETGCLSGTCSSEVDYESGKNGGEISTDSTKKELSTKTDTDVVSTQTIEERYHCETSNHDDCSTSGTNPPENLKFLQKNRRLGTGERNKRKRWRGRHEDLELNPELAPEKSSTLDGISDRVNKYEIVLGMKELTSRGMVAEVIEEINALDPNFFVQNPALLFQLKQLEFFKLVKSGDHSSALKVACNSLGPLAAKDPAFLKPLKGTLLTLLRHNEETLGEGLPLYAIATSLQVALARRLGIEEPQLMKIIRATLHTHGEWFKLQMCKDVFEGLLKIDALKEISTPLLADAASNSNVDTCTHDSSQVTVSSSSRMQEDGYSPTQVSSRDIVCDENAILKVMEFLALPRADAIHLLVQYNGDAEIVIQQIFA